MPTRVKIQQLPTIWIVLSCHLSKASTKLWFLCLFLYQTLLTDNLYLYQAQHLTLTIFPHLPLLFPILHISPWSMLRDPRTHCVCRWLQTQRWLQWIQFTLITVVTIVSDTALWARGGTTPCYHPSSHQPPCWCSRCWCSRTLKKSCCGKFIPQR